MDPAEHLLIEPCKTISKEEFSLYKPFSIAIDGYVPEAPYVDKIRPLANFNHHEKVNRLSTRSSAAQLYMHAKSGLFETLFCENGKPKAYLYVNDCDQDVCLTTWLMFHYDHFKGKKSSPLLTRLVSVSDIMDATSGMYPIDEEYSIREEMNWVYEPYTRARKQGKLGCANANSMREIMYESWNNIDQYLEGKGERLALDTRHDILGEGKNWVLIKEIGTDARQALVQSDKEFYSILREETTQGYAYVIGKISSFSKVELSSVYHQLNILEKGEVWSGSDLVGGCLREKRSKLSPDELGRILNSLLKTS